MKKQYYILVILSMLALSGCDKFLERKAQNLVVPTTCQQFKEMLQGDGYFYDLVNHYWWINLMTDDFEYKTVVSDPSAINEDNAIVTYRLVHQWASEIESEANGFYDTLFGYCYNQVLVANIVMDNIDNVDGSDDEIEILRGQALFQRAFAYFYLASLYADIYSAENLDKPCVALKLTSTPSTNTYNRNTVGEVWAQIRADIDESVRCLVGHNFINVYEINGNAALILAMRTALNMNDFEAVISYGEQLFSRNNKLYNITSKTACSTTENILGGSDVSGFISPSNPEIVWLYGASSYSVSSNISALVCNVFFAASADLASQYSYNATTKSGDHRLPYFFRPPGNMALYSMPCYYHCYSEMKYDSDDGYARANALRTAEAYLMMAEAYARKSTPDLAKSLQYLNTLRRNRIDSYTDLTTTDLPDAAAVVSFVLQERRRELCFEELHRWWDLRRMGKPELEHVWADGERYILNEGDQAYILDFPYIERSYDQSNANPRPIRTSVE